MIRVPVKPELLLWARHRAGLGRDEFPARFKKLPEEVWINRALPVAAADGAETANVERRTH